MGFTGKLRSMAAVAGLAVAATALAASGSSGKSATGSSATADGSHPAEADVVISKCAIADNQFEGPQADLTITNHSSKASNYIVQVVFTTKDGATQLDSANATVSNLAPGQVGSDKAVSVKQELRTKGADLACKVVRVTRLAA